MKRHWKSLLLALIVVGSGAFGFFTAPAEAAGCPKICCETTGRCYSCFPTSSGGCVCPDIACP